MEFTGDYNRCMKCGHIYDYMDVCPVCGADEIENLNVHEVKEWKNASSNKEANRLHKMLESHDDN
jgi:predicted  nucleic acid-binding Zn-ribbon protein